MAYHKYIACFSNVPFTIPTPYDCNLGKLSGGIPGNTTANNQNFVTHYYNQSGGFVLVPGTFIRLYDAFYPNTYTCYEYLGTSLTPEVLYVEFLGGYSLQNSGYFVEPYGDCSTCEIDPSIFAYNHSWRYCDNSIAFNPVPVVPIIGSCFLPNTETNIQIAQNQLTAALGPISIGDVVQLSDGTCMYYEGNQPRPTSYDIDASNNPGSGNWHAGYAPGNCGNAVGTPPTRGLIGSIGDCQQCPAVITTTTLTTIAPITTTTTTCYNCCTTTTTSGPCQTCGIESCCDPSIQYLATGNLLTLLNILQCNSTYAFFLPQLFVGGNGIYDECWKPLCNPPQNLQIATSTATYAYLTSNGYINALGCAGLSSTLPFPCCPPTTTTTTYYPATTTTTTYGPTTTTTTHYGQTTTTTTYSPTTTTTTVYGTTTTTTYTPVSTTTTIWYECVTPGPAPPPGPYCSNLINLPLGPGWNSNTASEYLIDERIAGNIALGTPLNSHYWESGTLATGNQCPTPGGGRYAMANVIKTIPTNILYTSGALYFTWQAWIDYLNSVTPATYTYVMSRTQVLNLMDAYSNNNTEGWAYQGSLCMCWPLPCYCVPCYTPGTPPCIYNNFTACDVAANAVPCCEPVSTTTSTTPPTTTTTTTLAIGLELCCPTYDQYIVPSGNFLYTLIQGLTINSAHLFSITLPNGNDVEVCVKVINNPNPTNVITNGVLLVSPSTDMDCYSWNNDLDINNGYGYTAFEDGCCPLEDYHECITPAPLVPGINANLCDASTTYVIPAGVNLGNNAIENRIKFVDHVVSAFGPTAAFMAYFYINPTAPSNPPNDCYNLGTLYGGAGYHESVVWIWGAFSNTTFIIPQSFSWDMVILFLNLIAGGNGFPQDFVNTDTWSQTQTKITNKVPGDALQVSEWACGCFAPCFCQPCTPPAPNCIYSTYALCDVAANAVPCCDPTTTTTTYYCDRLGLEWCCPPYTPYIVNVATSLYTIISNPAYTPGQTVLALEVTLPNGVVLTSCFKIIDTACPTWPVLTGGWSTPQLPPADWTTGQPNCITCRNWLSLSPWFWDGCPVTTTTTQWWECVQGHVPVPGVDAVYCDSSHTYFQPASISTANGWDINRQIFINNVASTFGQTALFSNYFYINPIVGPTTSNNVCVNTDPNLFNGVGEYQTVVGFVGLGTNTIYTLTGPVTTNANWQMLIDALNLINVNNAWPQDFLYTDSFGDIQYKILQHILSIPGQPYEVLVIVSAYCMCTVTCFCQVCSSGPNCIYTNEPDCLLSANATPCCITTTYAPPTTTTTTSNLVGLKLCCDPYTEYEVIYNSSLYNLIDYSLPPFTRAMVMTITLPNGSTLTACMQMDMNIPLGSAQVQTGQFEWLFSPTYYYSNCLELDLDAPMNSGYGFQQFLYGCCPPTTTTTTSAPLGVEECCSPFTQYVATGPLLSYLSTFSVGEAFYGALSGPSTATPNICFKIITNPAGLIVNSAVGYGPEDSCVDIDLFIINAGFDACCPTTTTTTYPPTTTTTTVLCDSCGVLFVDDSNPPNVYNYNHTANQVNLLFTATQNLGYSVDIARYGNLIWVYYNTKIQEYVIDPVTCVVNWVREITLPGASFPIGNGLAAINSTTLIGGSDWGISWGYINTIDITTNTAVLSGSITLGQDEHVAGDLLYLAGSNTLIVALSTNTGPKLAYYDLVSGVLLANISGDLTWGLYCYNQNIYGVTNTKDIYQIYVTSSSISTGSPLQSVPNPPPNVWGAASDPDCCIQQVTTTTTTSVVILGIELCCVPYTQYVASGSLLVYILGIPVGEAFAAWLVINNTDMPLCVRVINNASGPIVSSFSPICSHGGLTCDGLNTHLINYIPPGHGVAALEHGCCPSITTTTTEYVLTMKWIRACCPEQYGGSYHIEFAALPASNLEGILNGTPVGIVIELTVTPQGGTQRPSQCYKVTDVSTSPYSLADGFVTLMFNWMTCNSCNNALPLPPHSCVF